MFNIELAMQDKNYFYDPNLFSIEIMPDCFQNNREKYLEGYSNVFYEVIWFTEDSGIHTIDFNEYKAEKNSIFLISSGQCHEFNKAFIPKGYIIRFSIDFLIEKIALKRSFVEYNLLKASESAISLKIEDADAIKTLIDLVQKMIEEYNADPDLFGHEARLQCLLFDFLILVQRCGKNNTKFLPPKGTPNDTVAIFDKFKIEVEKNFRDFHSAKKYASLLKIGITRLNAISNQCCGLPARDYIDQRVMLEVKRLLRYSHLQIKEIILDTGFRKFGTFDKLFRIHVGCNPTEFRQRNL